MLSGSSTFNLQASKSYSNLDNPKTHRSSEEVANLAKRGFDIVFMIFFVLEIFLIWIFWSQAALPSYFFVPSLIDMMNGWVSVAGDYLMQNPPNYLKFIVWAHSTNLVNLCTFKCET